MGKLTAPCLAIFCLLALRPAAAPAQSLECYQPSSLRFFDDVVELVSWEKDHQADCWRLRMRLRGGPESPQGNAMICKGNACSTHLDLNEGIYWYHASPNNQNIQSVTVVERPNCTDVTFCIAPSDPAETMLIDFVALFEEGYFLPPRTFRPRWSHGVIDLSSMDGNKSHCQDDSGPPVVPLRVAGSICL